MNAYQAGRVLLCGDYTAYTPTGAGYFKKAKRWGTVPHEGDVIYFYTPSMGRISHTGIVESVTLRNGLYSIGTVEGNTAAGQYERDGGAVSRKVYEFLPSQVGGTNRIAGFGTPLFGADTCSAQQIIAIARSQIGYVEKASNKDLDEFRANPGDKNYTKYGRWAQASGWGYNPAQWCAMFVSWCAYMACRTARDYAPGWVHQDDGSWCYRKDDGNLARDEWVEDGGRWYVFAGDGKMITGWYKAPEGWYYLADDGGMCASQWVQDGDKSYYMTSSGLMATSAYIRATKPVAPGRYVYYWVDDSGVWLPQWDTDKPHLDTYELAV